MAGMDTAAMEALLTDLLKEARAQGKQSTAMFIRLAKAAGLDPKIIKEAESRLKELGDSAEEAAVAQSKLGKAGNIVGSLLADLVGGLTSTVGNLVKFAASTLSGKAQMSGLFEAFKDLPIIGTVASLFGAIVKLQEENLQMYRDLNASGINFGTSLSQLRVDFLEMGLTAESFTRLMKDAGETLVTMGVNATAGAKQLKAVNKELLANHKGLLNLGFSYEQLNHLTLDFAKVMGGLSEQQQKDSKYTAKLVAEYGKELDLLSKITGKSREQIQKDLEKQTQEANWEAFMASQDEKTRLKLQKVLKDVTAVYGEAGAQIAKARAMGLSVQGEAGQMLFSMATGAGQSINQMIDGAKDGSISVQQITEQSSQRQARLQMELAKAYPQLAATLQALALAGDPVAAQMQVMPEVYARLKNANITTEEQMYRLIEAEKIRLKGIEDATAADQAELQAQLEAEAALRKLAVQLGQALTPLISDLVIPTLKLLSGYTGQLAEAIKLAIPKIMEFFRNLSSPEGRKIILDNIAEFLKDLFGKIWELVKPSWIGTAGKVASTAGYTLAGAGAGAVTGATIGMLGGPGGAAVGALAGAITGLIAGIFQNFTSREDGSMGATGQPFENFGAGTPAMLHGTEGVFKPEQMAGLMSANTAETLRTVAQNLNTAEMVAQLKIIAENSRRTYDAVLGISGDAFA
jgi:hypothetical protein